jgi:hypothetical protein
LERGARRRPSSGAEAVGRAPGIFEIAERVIIDDAKNVRDRPFFLPSSIFGVRSVDGRDGRFDGGARSGGRGVSQSATFRRLVSAALVSTGDVSAFDFARFVLSGRLPFAAERAPCRVFVR